MSVSGDKHIAHHDEDEMKVSTELISGIPLGAGVMSIKDVDMGHVITANAHEDLLVEKVGSKVGDTSEKTDDYEAGDE